jgi:YcaO-like protein with predicted kinase domain
MQRWLHVFPNSAVFKQTELKMQQQLKRIKPYKALPPEETIRKIRTILESLDFHFIETPVKTDAFFRSFCLSIINPENRQIVFSTYGKGISKDWALASAWGEMVERIQNLAFYMSLIYSVRPEIPNQTDNIFSYFPDEKILSLSDDSGVLFENNFLKLTGNKLNNSRSDGKIIGVPFYNYFKKEESFFPFRALQVMVGSNGMCSGNTPKEALIQGISEIFERYVLKCLYLKPFCPPDIPLSVFENTEIQQKISKLESEFGYKVQIKDCSMDKRYPVIGVLVQNKNNAYAFHLGADPSPITALERCLTEMFQGGTICFRSKKEMEQNVPYDLKSPFWKKNLSRTIRAYAGHWPPAILSNEPSYVFKRFNHPVSVSDKEDLEYLFTILRDEGREVYIRNNSFLGHPSYFVYIPELSEITSFPDSTFSTVFLDFDKFLPLIPTLKNNPVQNHAEMAGALGKYILSSPEKQFNITDYTKYISSQPVLEISGELLLALLNFSLLKGKVTSHFTPENINSNNFLSLIFQKHGDFKPSEIFQKINLPDCFECNDCAFTLECNLKYISDIWEKVKIKMKSDLIDQTDLFYLENE